MKHAPFDFDLTAIVRSSHGSLISVWVLAVVSACADHPTAPQFGVSPEPAADATANSTAANVRADAASDRAVLNALYQATGGSNWTWNFNWGSDQPLYLWQGVRTDSKGRVRGLSLGNNGLTGAIPAELGQLTELEWLSLGGNNLTGAIPAELGQLAELRALWLESNNLTGPIPQTVQTLPKLEYSLADDNALSGPLPSALSPSIRYLTLADNELTGSIPYYQVWGLDVRRNRDGTRSGNSRETDVKEQGR